MGRHSFQNLRPSKRTCQSDKSLGSNSAVQICIPADSGPAFVALCLLVGWNLMNRVSFEAFLPRLEVCLYGLPRQSGL